MGWEGGGIGTNIEFTMNALHMLSPIFCVSIVFADVYVSGDIT